jgi:aryl-alcohol dehydrogenase-like predicted oxidoreductase
MSKIKRRTFTKNLAALGPAVLGACSNKKDSPSESDTYFEVPPGESVATDPVALGDSGLTVPRLAMGTGTHGWQSSSDQVRLGQDDFVRLMRHGIDRGASFLDTADLYGSHSFSAAVLREVPRDQVIVASKIWWRDEGGLPATDTAQPEIERFLRELGTDYLDIALIHSLLNDTWQTDLARMRDELSMLKDQGIVRAVGCSCHTHATLRQAAEDPWVDVIFARVNPAGVRMDPDANVDQVNETLRLARANGKGVVGMKIYGEGGYSNDEQRFGSLKSAFENDLVDAITVGHMSTEQFDNTINNMDRILLA